MAELLIQISVLFIAAAVAASIAKILKQPVIPAYITVGILLGPILGLITDPEIIKNLSEIGIAFLLFIVGLELDFKRVRNVGYVAIFGGIAQLVILFGAAFLTGHLLGYSPLESSYLGWILAFSSTMVVISLLSDNNQLDTLHGKIMIGILLLQDIVAVLALTFYATLGDFVLSAFILKIFAGAGLFLFALFMSKNIFPSIFRLIARSRELFFIISLAMVFGFAILFTYVGFSFVVGAFVAGIALGNLPYNMEIVSRVVSLKDFFGVLFFVGVGTELVLVDLTSIVLPLIIIVLLQMILLPAVTLVILGIFGYKTRTALLTALGLSQVSEFALILVGAGLTYGHIGNDIFKITVLGFIITVILTSYMLKFQNQIYNKLAPILKPLEKLSKKNREIKNVKDSGHEVILVGMDRIGYSVYRTLKKLHKDFVVVDFNPDVIKRLHDMRIACIYGDISDEELLRKIHLKQAKLIISTVPDFNQNMLLIKTAVKHSTEINIIVTAYSTEDALNMYKAGAHYVILPHYLGGDHVSILLEDVSTDLDKLLMHKISHVRELKKRKELHPKHT